TVKVKADAGFSYERASEVSKNVATSYSREVVDRAVSRIQEKIKEQRTQLTREEIEEINDHQIDNKSGTGHITGIYRWVNKIYKAEIVNYGQRLMYEIIIPEPASFYRYAQSAKPIEGITIEKPDPPGYMSGSQFIPLTLNDLNSTSYLAWVAKYNVSDVSPPPANYITVGTALSKEGVAYQTGSANINKDLVVPDGYVAKNAWLRIAWNSWDGNFADAFIGKEYFNDIAYINPGMVYMNDESGSIPVAIHTYNTQGFSATVEVKCQRTNEHYVDWQIKTFNAIMVAYNELKSKYDEQVKAAQVQSGIAISGRNPLINREIEKKELKKLAITILTNQHFDLFDAMVNNVPPNNYPELNIFEANEEGKYMQFFEQAFEWENMTYLLYPYFWGKKTDWVLTSQLEDTDPLFEKFLQAGAARVLLPVRPNYEQPILHYFETEGEIWEGGDPPHVDDPLYVSIVDSLQELQGVTMVEGSGLISVDNGNIVVTGLNTDFNEEYYNQREIFIEGVRYIIDQVISPTELNLTEPYKGVKKDNIPYYLGVQRVGIPWEVNIPTSLVWLDQGSNLPDWTVP
ncbi:MAG: hypothetical protein ACFFD1_09615, partial [Candidatus Thorarchaeota archaeon]